MPMVFYCFQSKAERVHEELQLVVDYMSNVMQPLLSSSFVVLPVSTYSPTCTKQAPKGQSKSACLRQVLA